ncbi:MAG: HEAT repeat domain-containing protein [Thermoguttaceae bacterium]|jgi:outer membrane protein assembly factor BamB
MRSVVAFILVVLGGQVAVAADAPQLGHPDFYPSPQHPVGYRGDWTGRYPGATPSDFIADRYILWKTYVGTGEASPIVVGDRVFAFGDGVRLSCVNKDDGTLLWQHEHHAKADDPAEKKAWNIEEYIIWFHRARRATADATAQQKAIAALEEDAKNRKAEPDSAKLAGLRAKKAEAEKIAAEATKARAAIDLGALGFGKEFPESYTYALATPCCDGQNVCLLLPMGAVACYDLKGNRKWYRFLESRVIAGHYLPSPLLVDGRLIVCYGKTFCMDPATGDLLWEARPPGVVYPSPISGKVGSTTYIALGNSSILRLSDGKEVYRKNWTASIPSPIFYEGIFFWGSHAVKVFEDPEAKPKFLWDTDPTVGDLGGEMTGQHGYASPLFHKGVIYYESERPLYLMLDAFTGEVLSHAILGEFSGAKAEKYSGLTLAGNHLYSPNCSGFYLVATPAVGKDFRILHKDCFWGRGGSMFVFEGNRLYAQTAQHTNDDPRGRGWLCCSGDPLTFPLRSSGWRPAMFADAKAADVPKLMEAARSGEVAARRQAIDALCRLGPEAKSAVPLLGELLDDPDDSVALAAVRAIHAMATDATSLIPEVVRRIEGADREKKRLALHTLRALGPHGKGAWRPAIRLLGMDPIAAAQRSLMDLNIRLLAVDALRAAGMAALPDLADIVSKDAEAWGGYWGWDRFGRGEALGLIRALGPAAREAAPALARCMKERSPLGAANTLLAVDPDTLLSTDCFAILTARADPKVGAGERIAAIQVIGNLGAKAAAAVDLLEGAATDKNPGVAAAAKAALEKIRR